MAPANDEEINICVVAMSGKTIIELNVLRQIFAEDLYDLAGSSFPPGTIFKLAYEDQLLQRDSQQPLLHAQPPVVLSFTSGWHCRDSSPKDLFLDGGGLCNLVRRGRHKLAHAVLTNSRKEEVEELVSDGELLSWVAYSSGGARQGSRPDGRPLPGALRLLWELILRNPGQVQRRDPDTGKLPLHDAAWGHAPFEAAVMIAAAFPAAVQDRRNRGRESPADLGHYVHPKFSWPSSDELTARASRLRKAGQLMGRMRNLVPQRQVGLQGCLDGGLKLGLRPSFLIASCLTDCKELIHSGLVPATVVTLCSLPVPVEMPAVPLNAPRKLPQSNTCNSQVIQAPRKPSHQQRPIFTVGPSSGPHVKSRSDLKPPSASAVDHLRESFVKDSGLYGGARRVRNRRCSFNEVSEILVGEKRFKLETHASHTVHTSIQRSKPAKVWPCKSVWQKERLQERRERWSFSETEPC